MLQENGVVLFGRIRTLYGADADPEACEDFQNITGSAADCSWTSLRESSIALFMAVTAASWRELTPYDIYMLSDGEDTRCQILVTALQGIQLYLPKQESADSVKYQKALNQLALRETQLYLEAFEHDPIPFMIMENVPGIRTRGKSILASVKSLLKKAGYVLRNF